MTHLADMLEDLDDVLYDTSSGFALSAKRQDTGQTVTVILDNPYYEADPGGSVMVSSQELRARIRESEAIGLSVGETLTMDDGLCETTAGVQQKLKCLRDGIYQIMEMVPNGEGEILLMLHEL